MYGMSKIVHRTNGQITRCKKHIRGIRANREESGYTTHIVRNSHRYGKMEEIREKIDHARNGRIMNMEENPYIYICKQTNS
jgi:hypothetical protein